MRVKINGGTQGIMVIDLGSGLGLQSSNPEQDYLHFTQCLYPWERYESNYSSSCYGQIVG